MRRFASEAGVALVEFALIAPVLLFLLIGILDVARGVNAYVTISNAAREGAHYAALHPGGPPADIANAVRARVVPLDPTGVAVTATYWDGAGFQPWPASGIPRSSPATFVPARVQVSYPWNAVTLLIGQFFSGDPMTASSTMEAVR